VIKRNKMCSVSGNLSTIHYHRRLNENKHEDFRDVEVDVCLL